MKHKIDILEIINAGTNKNQEQNNAPDFDFLNVRELMVKKDEKSAPKPASGLPFKKVPEQKTVIMSEPEQKAVPKPESKAVPKPEPKAVPKPEPVITPELQQPPVTAPEPVCEPEPAPEAIPEPQRMIAPEPENTPAAAPEPKKQLTWKSLLNLAVVIIIIAILFAFMAGIPKIQGNSMDPMLSSGDRAVICKVEKKFKKGDIILFKGPEGEKLAARIVATKGDVVSLNNIGGLYINNKLQEEENIHTVTTITDPGMSYPVIVDEETYFVLGDNRTDSVDSRDSRIGLISEDDIKGKIVFCFKKIK